MGPRKPKMKNYIGNVTINKIKKVLITNDIKIDRYHNAKKNKSIRGNSIFIFGSPRDLNLA